MTTATLDRPRKAKALPSMPPTGRKRFLLDLRNSTLGQVDNFSAKEQVESMIRVSEQRHPGCEVIVVDEQGTSGTDLSKRYAFSEALKEIENDTAHGIVAYDVKRLSRDPFGIDGGRLAKMLVEHHGILVTMARDYNLRLDNDHTAFNFELLMAGIDLRGIRNTLARGLFRKMDQEAVFRRPPLGYMTVREFGERAGTTVKYTAKNPEHAHAMAGIQQAFETCPSLTAACVWLTANGYERPPFQFRDKEEDGTLVAGRVVDYWTPRMLKYILATNEIYTGTFVFGRDGNRRSPVWEATGRQDGGSIRTEVPHLAYWTLADQARWKRKFLSSWRSDVTRSRTRKHPHPLTGVLTCGACGHAMVGAGNGFYRCQATSQGRCDQWVSIPALLRTLRPLLPDLLASAQGIAAEWADQGAGVGASPAQAELDAVELRAGIVRRKYLGMEEDDPEVKAALEDLNRRVKVLKAKVQEEAAEAAQRIDTAALVEMLETLPHLFDELPPEQQSRIYATLLSDITLTSTGYKSRRVHTVQSATPRLSRLSRLTDGSSPYTVDQASSLADLAQALQLLAA